MARENDRGHGTGGRDQLRLAGEKGRDGRLVVAVAGDGCARRRKFAQDEIFDRATGHADALAGEIGRPGDLNIRRAEHAAEERGIGGGEIDHFFPRGALAEARNDQIDFSGLQIRQAVFRSHRHQGQAHAELGGDKSRHVDVIALRLHIDPDRPEGRKVLRHGNADRSRLAYVIERVGARGGASGQPARRAQGGEKSSVERTSRRHDCFLMLTR